MITIRRVGRVVRDRAYAQINRIGRAIDNIIQDYIQQWRAQIFRANCYKKRRTRRRRRRRVHADDL